MFAYVFFFFCSLIFANVFFPWYQINRLLLEDDAVSDKLSSEYQSIITEFRAFLSDCKDVLDEATTMKLLERYFLFANFFSLIAESIHWIIEKEMFGCPV